MSSSSKHSNQRLWTRRQLLTGGLTGLGIAAVLLKLGSRPRQALASIKIPPLGESNSTSDTIFDPMSILRDFNYGKVKQENGRRVREFEVVAKSSTLQLNSAISFVSWNLNDRVPGPTLRATEGDRVRVIFHNEGGRSHSMHFHGIHVYRTGRTLKPSEETDAITLGTAERHILEFAYSYPGQYMFHPHQDVIAENGCMGYFDVIPS